ncbi:MAG: hypothetical protein FWB85_00810 [Chitinispirillia bacterium]|nr:hypothetical protein [Chitinispirillia bacterium]MCL2241042.1 hypothetical protein [Chitinispirillia bacterium]
MEQRYDLKDLLRNPHVPVTREHFEKCMAMTNDDKSASEVDIGPAIDELVKEINERGSYWW